MRSAAYRPQAGFPAALYEDDPAQTIFLRGISLLALHRRDGLVPVRLAHFGVVLAQSVFAHPPCVGVAYSLSTARIAQLDALAAALA